jgi:hypothetical protein
MFFLLMALIATGASPPLVWRAILRMLPVWIVLTGVFGTLGGRRFWRAQELLYVYGLEVETYQAGLDEAAQVPQTLPTMTFRDLSATAKPDDLHA